MSANFEPNQNEYKNLTPFKNWLLLQINTWGLNNFPFVESDFDELTNYGMMQKLMGAVNDVISNENEVEQDMTNLFGAFTELQTYVNDYFDNLDVQDEVNNKLDQMANDGTLTNLIKDYIDPIQEAFEDDINSQISEISARVQASYSGAPIPVASTSSMTDTTKVYVNTTNGYWYYYDGDSWEQGGVYQSTGISDDIIEGKNIKHHDTINPDIFDDINSGMISLNGNLTANANWSCTDFIKVNTGDVLKINLARGRYLEKFNSSKAYIGHEDTNETSFSQEKTYTITANTEYVRLNIYINDLNTYSLKINDVDYFGKYLINWLAIDENNLDAELKQKLDEINLPFILKKWSNKNMVMFGDSLVSAELDDAYRNGYVGRLKNLLTLNIASNQGVSGRPMANGTPNGDGTNTTINNFATFTNYDLCLIAVGTNDFKLNVPLGSLGQIGDTTFDTNTFYGAYRDAIEHILTVNPEIRICLWTPLQRDNSGYDVNYTNAAGCKLIDYVNAIKEIGKMYAIPVLDLYATSGVTELTLSTFTADGLHLNSTGYDYVSDYAASYINNI